VCAAKLNITEEELKFIYGAFQADALELEASGFGSCARIGIYTGAGAPHGRFARMVRALPSWKVRRISQFSDIPGGNDESQKQGQESQGGGRRVRGPPKAAFELISRLDGRWVDDVPRVATHEALAMLPEKHFKTYKGLERHTDNNIIKEAPEVQERLKGGGAAGLHVGGFQSPNVSRPRIT
jgi:hypothetical protein